MIRKINSKKDDAKRQKRNQLYLGIGLSLLMLFSVFGIMTSSFGEENEEKITYKGYEFVQKGAYYELTIGDNIFYFSENPNDAAKVSVEMNITKILPNYAGKPMYLDSADYGVNREIFQNLQGYPLRIQNACYDEKDCITEDLPIKDCSENIIIVRTSVENKIYEKDSCIFIEGQSEDLIKLTDLFLLKIMGLN